MTRGIRGALGLVVLLAGTLPAHATGNFLCEIDDPSLKFTAESAFSHGLGEAFLGFKANLEVRLEDAPKDWASLDIDSAGLVHHWFAGGDLNLHIYREREGNAPHGYVELIVTTEQNARDDDETAFDGTYELTVYEAAEPENKTWTAKGKVSCSVG
jgi:hypothetical protein